jgi:hypothetical protein
MNTDTSTNGKSGGESSLARIRFDQESEDRSRFDRRRHSSPACSGRSENRKALQTMPELVYCEPNN